MLSAIRAWSMIAAATLLVSCRGPEEAAHAPPSDTGPISSPAQKVPPSTEAGTDRVARWTLQPSDRGTELVLLGADKIATMRLICPAGKNQLLVNVPGFRPITSEERLSFGGDGSAMTFVADTRGDAERGGISAVSDIPDDLANLAGRPLSASYGVQKSGPYSPPPRHMFNAFVGACGEGLSAQAPTDEGQARAVGACSMQGSERLRTTPRRAVGTEPFWTARTEGRCVIYSHPENQDGTRIWTKYSKGSKGSGAETWLGSLGKKRFELRIYEQANCSDGMSDKRYPLAAELLVSGELRRGCAEPA